jgi:hypothetical protein
MILEQKHCKHCGTPYRYQASGYGCFDADNDRDYCPDCKKAIINALSEKPKKVVKKWRETTDVPYEKFQYLKTVFDEKVKKADEDYNKTMEEWGLKAAHRLGGIGRSCELVGFPNLKTTVRGEGYYYNNANYRIEFDKEDNKTIFVETEWFIKEEKWGKTYWKSESDHYYDIGFWPSFTADQIKAKPMKPLKPIDWNLEWELIPKKVVENQ